MRVAKFLAGLLAATIVHVLGVRMVQDFSSAIDVFLVVALFNARAGGPFAGLLGGLATGWCADVMTGGLYGAYGFCNTLVGYGAAVAVQRLVIKRAEECFFCSPSVRRFNSCFCWRSRACFFPVPPRPS